MSEDYGIPIVIERNDGSKNYKYMAFSEYDHKFGFDKLARDKFLVELNNNYKKVNIKAFMLTQIEYDDLLEKIMGY